jgi:hypothetical protein
LPAAAAADWKRAIDKIDHLWMAAAAARKEREKDD